MGDVPGDMRERVTIKKETRGADGAGGSTVTWANVSDTPTVWARLQPISDSETVKSLSLNAATRFKVRIRYRSDLANILSGERYYLEWRGQPLHIEGVMNPDQKRQYLEITCVQGQQEPK